MNNEPATNESRRKRSHDNRNIVTGRSLKRLRLDQTLVTVPTTYDRPHRPFDSQSIGTLSVGTFGGDLESNDEDTGQYEEEEEEIMSASQSSWVASLPSLNSRKRMVGVGFDGKMPAAAAAAMPQRAYEDGDDAATCAEMTTAAVAPRRRVRYRSCNKDNRMDASSPPMNGERKQRTNGLKDDGLAVDEIRLGSSSMFRSPAAQLQNSQNHHGSQISMMASPPVDLAEDEASLSAISLGGASRGTSTSKDGIARLPSNASDVGMQHKNSVDLKAPPSSALGSLNNSNNSMQNQRKTSDYNLNSFLGNLHRERQQRQSIQTSPHRRGSSYHSLGSMGVNSHVSGNSHQSCPTYAPVNAGVQVQLDNAGDMDVDMEGPTGSISSSHVSQTNSASASQSGSEGKGTVPKWKRKVKLPSHSSLY
eukprot:scaffold30900_cov68-Cyclotella_meneghiniana.AAC.3